MKTFKLLLPLGSAIMIAGCHTTTGTISGRYVQGFQNEYSIASDTLIIEPYNLSVGAYQVKRRCGYHRIREGKVLPKEYSQEKWMATFDKDKRVLQETALGRQIYIKSDGSLTYDGSYVKIK